MSDINENEMKLNRTSQRREVEKETKNGSKKNFGQCCVALSPFVHPKCKLISTFRFIQYSDRRFHQN